MQIDILTLFPGMFNGPLTESILKRAQQAHRLTVRLHNIRAYATDKHQTTDDYPYGGGAGMVMKPVPLAAAIRGVLAVADDDHRPPPVILLSPDGVPFTQQYAAQLATLPRMVLVCGHYEGVDERIRTTLISDEVSIGDYVLTGGELAAMVVVDAVARLLPGVLAAGSTHEESHTDGLLEYPQYTRPATWEGHSVPPILLSGNHGAVATWRRQQRLLRTWERRPDMLAHAAQMGWLTAADQQFLRAQGWLAPAAPPDRSVPPDLPDAAPPPVSEG